MLRRERKVTNRLATHATMRQLASVSQLWPWLRLLIAIADSALSAMERNGSPSLWNLEVAIVLLVLLVVVEIGSHVSRPIYKLGLRPPEKVLNTVEE